MKKIPVYASYVIMYILIAIGLYRFYKAYLRVEVIIPTVEPRTIVPIPILIIFSVILFIVLISVGMQILVVFWNWLKEHQTLIVYPFLIIAIGFAQLAIAVMTVVRTMIETNATMFIENLTLYIQSTEQLIYWILAGVIIGGLGVVYEVYLRYAQ
jgi:hypothetical protein